MSRLALLHAQLKKVIGGRSLPFLSIAGNVFTVKDGENEQNVSAMDKENGNVVYVDVHVIDASPFMSKTYYEAKYDPDGDPVAPTCYSNDGFKPAEDATKPQCSLCAQCPNNAWGSRMTDNGKKAKACNDSWKVAVIVPEHHDEKVLTFRITPGSLASWLAYIGQFNDYPYPGQDRKMTVGDVITRIYFESGKTGVINFMPLNFLNPTDETDRLRIELMEKLVNNGETELYIGLDNISVEKKEEVLALAAPAGAEVKKLEAPKPAAVKQVAAKPPVAEEAEEEEEAEITPPPSKAQNATLPSETMRFKKMAAQSTPAPTFKKNGAAEKAPVGDPVKNMLAGIMNMKTS